MRTKRHSFRKQHKNKTPWSPLLNEPKKNKKRDWISAILLTLAAHLLIIFFLPKLWKPITLPLLLKEPTPLELEFEVSKQVDQYIETNPYVALQEPPRTPYFASRSQLAAQPEPHSSKKDYEPTLDGEEPLSQKIVQAQIVEEPAPPQPSILTQDPTSVDKLPSEITSVLASDLQEISVPQITEGPETQKKSDPIQKLIAAQNIEITQIKESRPKPRPRPRVEQPSIPAPLRKTFGGTSRLGQTAISARFSEYGAYLDRLFESIYYQWKLLLTNYKFLAEDYGGAVEVRFTLDKEGHINNMKVVQASTSELATFICKDSICSLAPFDSWTDQMVKTLGEEQELGIVFHFR